MPKPQPPSQTSASTNSETTIWTGIAWGIILGGTAVLVIFCAASWMATGTPVASSKEIGVAIVFAALIVFSAIVYLVLPIEKSHQSRIGTPSDPETTNSDREDRSYGALQFVLIVLCGLGIMLLVTTAYKASHLSANDNGFGSGTFGDAFGAATSLFTALAFIGLLLTSHMQRRELGVAKNDQRMTKRILDKQEESLRNQILEDRLFKIFDRLDAFSPQQRAENDRAFQLISSTLTMFIKSMDFSIMTPQKIRAEIGGLLEGEIVHSLRVSHLNSNIQMLLHELVLADQTIRSGKLHAFSNLLISRVPEHVSFLVHISSISGKLGFENPSIDGSVRKYTVTDMFFSKLNKDEKQALEKTYLAMELQQDR